MSDFNIIMLIWVMFSHWFADFIFQTDWMAKNKSSNIKALLYHIETYNIVLFLFSLMFLLYNIKIENIFYFALINAILHFIIDFFTSKANAKLWKEQRVHEFFVMIGLDQLLHFICLLITMNIFLI